MQKDFVMDFFQAMPELFSNLQKYIEEDNKTRVDFLLFEIINKTADFKGKLDNEFRKVK